MSTCLNLIVHHQTWPTFVHKNLQIQKPIPSHKETKTYWRKYGKLLLLVHPSFLHVKQSLTILLFENPETYANLLPGLMPDNYNPTPCVRRFRLVFRRVGISIYKPIDSGIVRKARSFEITVLSFFQRTGPECKTDSFYTTN